MKMCCVQSSVCLTDPFVLVFRAQEVPLVLLDPLELEVLL